jgi:hypothetical protein
MPPNRAFLKRQKELARQERQREKDQKRKQRKDTQGERSGIEGEDPDLAGIVLGPQPPQEDV